MGKRTEPVELEAYGEMLERMVRALGRRLADADVESLVVVWRLRKELDRAEAQAVAGMRANGYSNTDMAKALGVSRQAMQQRFPGGR